MTPYWICEKPTGLRLLFVRVGFVAGIIGWLALLAALVGAPIGALIYHLTH